MRDRWGRAGLRLCARSHLSSTRVERHLRGDLLESSRCWLVQGWRRSAHRKLQSGCSAVPHLLERYAEAAVSHSTDLFRTGRRKVAARREPHPISIMPNRSPGLRASASLHQFLATRILVLVPLLVGCAPSPPPSMPAPESVAAAALRGSDSLHVSHLAPGVSHVHAWDARGPWAIHVLEAELGACGAALSARKAGPPLTARAVTSTLTAGTLGGVNADFFLLPTGTPVGAHVEDGQVLIGPGARPVVAVTGDRPWMGTATLRGVLTHGAGSISMSQVNRWSDATAAAADAGAVLFTHWHGARTPDDGDAVAARIRRIDGTPSAGRGVVESIESGARGLALDSARVVFAARGTTAVELRTLSAGDTVAWRAEVVIDSAERDAAEEAVGGFPILLRGGEPAPELEAGVQPAFGERRHPRTAVGWSEGGSRLFLVTVDGRQPGYSDGMTLRELAMLLRRLGAAEAINLDGGGSTAMVVRDAVVNRPSDREGERPVANALLLDQTPCR